MRLPELVARRRWPRYDLAVVAPTVLAVVAAVVFLRLHVAAGDLWAARARQSAAAHGVGVTYWFSWFGGGSSPGGYSVLTPFLSAVIGSALLGAVATVAITPLCATVARGANHPIAATWVATFVFGLNLWSGRIPFAVGSALSCVVVMAVRRNRSMAAACAAGATALVSPVSGAFVILGLLGCLLTTSNYRRAAGAAMLAAALALLGLAALFGSSGPDPIGAMDATVAALALLLLLVARPAKFVIVPLIAGIVACPALVMVPNALGGNVNRFVWTLMPIAVVATARVHISKALLGAGLALVFATVVTLGDLRVAFAPASATAPYESLYAELHRIPRLDDYRVEAVPDGTRTADYALLGYATLARGYETQVDDHLDAPVTTRSLTAATYRRWLDDNAVAYVVLHRTTLSIDAEYRLVAAGTRYLTPVWSDPQWVVFRVRSPKPIVSGPSRIVDADQSNLVIHVARPGTVLLRLRWSPYLRVDALPRTSLKTSPSSEATLSKTAAGWTTLVTHRAGLYVLHGAA